MDAAEKVNVLERGGFDYIQVLASRSFTHGRAKGGLLIVFKSDFYSIMTLFKHSNFLFVKVRALPFGIVFIIGLIYTAPNDDLDASFFQGNIAVSHVRKSLDVILNNRGKKLINILESCELTLLNGRCISDNPAKFTHVSSLGASVIDLVWCSWDALCLVCDLRVSQITTSSDHFSIILSISGLRREIVPNTISKLKFHNEKALLFSAIMSERKEVATVDLSVEEMRETFTSVIENVARSVGMVYQFNPNKRSSIKPWVDTECKIAKKKVESE